MLSEVYVSIMYYSTNLYGSLWFGTNEGIFLRRRFRPLHLCAPPITDATYEEGYYVEFFYTCLPLGVGVKNVKGIKGVK